MDDRTDEYRILGGMLALGDPGFSSEDLSRFSGVSAAKISAVLQQEARCLTRSGPVYRLKPGSAAQVRKRLAQLYKEMPVQPFASLAEANLPHSLYALEHFTTQRTSTASNLRDREDAVRLARFTQLAEIETREYIRRLRLTLRNLVKSAHI